MSASVTPRPAGRRKRFVTTPWRGRLVGFGSAAVAALLVWVAAPAWLSGVPRAVAAYDAAVLVLIAMLLALAMHADSADTAIRSQVDDPGRNFVLFVVLCSVVAGLGSAVFILGTAPHVARLSEKMLVYGLGLTAVVAGWAVIHLMLTFRYAHLFYYDDDDDNEADRGLTFPGTENPNDFDFAYFSFVVGMTFQVSDVQITDSRVRRLVLFHGLISFAYNASIIALVINLLSGLFH